MKTINRQELNELMVNDGLTLVEVLAPEYFKSFHLPHAINIPLDDDFDERIQKAVPDKKSPVVVYCANSQCTASTNAARRMEDLGYENVLDYEAGKADRDAAGLPIET